MFDKLLARLGRELDDQAIPYVVIGGQAVLQHGVPRFTRDIDISLGVDTASTEVVLQLADRCGLKPLPPAPRQFVERTFILPVVDPETEIRVDFAFTFTSFEQQAIARAVRITVGGYAVCFASVEDLIIHKLFAGRPRDIEDIQGVLARKAGKVDREYLRRWVREFSKVEGKGHLLRQLDDLLAET
jgi:predicted nucleotidyltransferase